MLKICNIGKTYKAGKGTVQALKDISLEFGNTGLVLVTGPSGAGKTTLLRIIAGYEHFTEGNVILNGISFRTCRDRLECYGSQKVSMLSQEQKLPAFKTVIQCLKSSEMLKKTKRSEQTAPAEEMLEVTGIAELRDRKAGKLSEGQKRRVLLAEAMLNDPDLVLLDEPTGMLDRENSEKIAELMKKASEKNLVIAVSHDVDLMTHYADRIITIRDGSVVSDVTKEKEHGDIELIGDDLEFGEISWTFGKKHTEILSVDKDEKK